MKNGEAAWKWMMRLTALVLIGRLLVTEGLAAPTQYYVLLLGLLFGPEIILGKIKLKVEQVRTDDADADVG